MINLIFLQIYFATKCIINCWPFFCLQATNCWSSSRSLPLSPIKSRSFLSWSMILSSSFMSAWYCWMSFSNFSFNVQIRFWASSLQQAKSHLLIETPFSYINWAFILSIGQKCPRVLILNWLTQTMAFVI